MPEKLPAKRRKSSVQGVGGPNTLDVMTITSNKQVEQISLRALANIHQICADIIHMKKLLEEEAEKIPMEEQIEDQVITYHLLYIAYATTLLQMDNQQIQDPSDDVCSRPNWPARVKKSFVELLIEEMKNHLDVIPSGCKDDAWDCVCTEFNKETGLNYDKLELKQHLVVLRKRYRIVKPLYNLGGFGWDYRQKMVDVDDEVWAEYIEVHPEIASYRKWGCPIYEELCTIFTKPLATGGHAYSCGGYTPRNRSNMHTRENVNIADGRNKRQRTEPSSLVQRSLKGDNPKAIATSDSRTASESKKDASAEKDDPYSAGCCMTILNGMQGVDQRLYNCAMELFKNPTWRQTFMSLKTEKRLNCLKAMLPSVR